MNIIYNVQEFNNIDNNYWPMYHSVMLIYGNYHFLIAFNNYYFWYKHEIKRKLHVNY